MKKLIRLFILPAAVLLGAVGCTREVSDVNENVYSFDIKVSEVREGESVPVRLTFSDAGLSVDNASWGNPWAKAYFHGRVETVSGLSVDNAIFYYGDGVIGEGSRLDIGPSRTLDIAIGSLPKGQYKVVINMETRYTVDTWASAYFNVLERGGGPVEPTGDVFVEDIIIPGEESGIVIDPVGDYVLDIRQFNASYPFRFMASVTPANASDRRISASAEDGSVLDAEVEGELGVVITPKEVGRSAVTLRSLDGNASRTFGVKVIRGEDPATGFTLPTDEGEGADLDLGGRLALDINDFVVPGSKELIPGKVYEYVCRSIPDGSPVLSLKAESDTPSVVIAEIREKNHLVLRPQNVGYATVTVSTLDDTIVRKLKVAVISNITLVMTVEEGSPSDEDKKSGIFPCKIIIDHDSRYVPLQCHLQMYGRAAGRIDLTDRRDYFLREELKNSRSAFTSFDESVKILVVSNASSGYNVYTRLMSKIASRTEWYHHSDDYPNYGDYEARYLLYSVTLTPDLIYDFDTNLYRFTIQKDYDRSGTRIYQYLH